VDWVENSIKGLLKAISLSMYSAHKSHVRHQARTVYPWASPLLASQASLALFLLSRLQSRPKAHPVSSLVRLQSRPLVAPRSRLAIYRSPCHNQSERYAGWLMGLEMREGGGMQSVLGCSPLIAFADSAGSSELLMLLVQQAVSRKWPWNYLPQVTSWYSYKSSTTCAS
jgi:hypothetical protein